MKNWLLIALAWGLCAACFSKNVAAPAGNAFLDQRLMTVPMSPFPHTTLVILAWNEEESIGATLRSLAGQTFLAQRQAEAPGSVEILVVPNGCSDATPQVARQALEDLRCQFPALCFRLEELAEGGKANAWNAAVHSLSNPATELFFFLDADIRLLTPQTLAAMAQALADHPEAVVATDEPVKHLALQPGRRRSLRERLLLLAGEMTKATPGQLTGQLYAARAHALRQIWIPRGIIVEDGFLKQLLCTEGYAGPVNPQRMVRAEGAAHVFECYTRWSDIWSHQVRQALGHTLYTYFTKTVREEMPERPIFPALRARCLENPAWFTEVIQREVARRGWWVMDTPSLWMRWRRVRHAKGLRQKLRFLAVAVAAWPFDVAVFLAANQRLRLGRVRGVWKDTRTTTLSA